MSRKIRKVAVLGSGVMGSGIACHLANIGLQVLMLDIVPFNITDEERKNPRVRNSMAAKSLKTALKSKPAPLYDNAFASRIEIGNFDDDMSKIADCDWIIEVVIERLDIKQSVYKQVENHRKADSLITSNTSGIPIGSLAEGRSENFRKHFCGTHFFNPTRYMKLFEVIPHQGTDPEIIDFWMQYGERYLGKKSVLCKDTPAFIANRIGFFSGSKISELTQKYNLKIEEVDKLTGPAMGWPSTGSYRLLDLVGFDTSQKVRAGVVDNAPKDEYVIRIKDDPAPKYVDFLLDNKFLGNKTGQGFYKKTNDRDDKGKRIILALDLNTLEYKPSQKPRMDVLGIAKSVELMDKRMKKMIGLDTNGGKFYKEYFAGLFAYSANRIPEISDQIYSIDDAMKAGYAWGYGPFQYWDMIGIQAGVDMALELGEQIPDWINEMLVDGHTSFYITEDRQRKYYNLTTKSYQVVPGTEDYIVLDAYREQTPVFKNSECTVHDIGDRVLCFEFTTKANAIGEGIGIGMEETLRIAEQGDWKGIVLGNNAKNFTVGANLMAVGMLAMQEEWEDLEEMIDGFQQINMAMRYSSIPIVTATQGYVFGGGCEMLMHTDAAVVSAESYLGLVEVGVGLIPGGGGTKEFALRASESYFEGDTKIPTLIEKLKAIATANVATSGYEGYTNGVLLESRDRIEVNTDRVLSEAKKKVLALADNYTPPVPKMITVLGRSGLSTLYAAINEFYLGKYMSEYDVEIGRKVAYILCGGDLTGEQQVSEQYLLDLEKEAFMDLLKNKKTQERIQYTLMNNKPLRN